MKFAIVVDMWLAGFHVLSLANMYVYKSMSGHNLMQAIRPCKSYIAVIKNYGNTDVSKVDYSIAITKELADALRKNKTIDWQKRDSARAKMSMLLKKT